MGDIVPTITSSRESGHTLKGMEIVPVKRYWATAWWGPCLTTRGARWRWLAYLKALASVIVYRLTHNPMFLS